MHTKRFPMWGIVEDDVFNVRVPIPTDIFSCCGWKCWSEIRFISVNICTFQAAILKTVHFDKPEAYDFTLARFEGSSQELWHSKEFDEQKQERRSDDNPGQTEPQHRPSHLHLCCFNCVWSAQTEPAINPIVSSNRGFSSPFHNPGRVGQVKGTSPQLSLLSSVPLFVILPVAPPFDWAQSRRGCTSPDFWSCSCLVPVRSIWTCEAFELVFLLPQTCVRSHKVCLVQNCPAEAVPANSMTAWLNNRVQRILVLTVFSTRQN